MNVVSAENAGTAFSFLMQVFDFISNHGIAGAIFLLWVREMIATWLERDERKSSQKELNQISKDTESALRDMNENAKATNALFERMLNASVRPNGKSR
jgi:hypothetical protein